MTDVQTEYKLALPKTYDTIQAVGDWLIGRLNQKFADRLHLTSEQVEWLAMAQYADLDYRLMLRGNVFVGYFEIKTRRHVKGYYDLEKVPYRKYKLAQYYLKETGKKSWYICRWVDCVGVFPLYQEPDEVGKQVARHDRGNKQDVYAFYDHNRAKVIIKL